MPAVVLEGQWTRRVQPQQLEGAQKSGRAGGRWFTIFLLHTELIRRSQHENVASKASAHCSAAGRAVSSPLTQGPVSDCSTRNRSHLAPRRVAAESRSARFKRSSWDYKKSLGSCVERKSPSLEAWSCTATSCEGGLGTQ